MLLLLFQIALISQKCVIHLFKTQPSTHHKVQHLEVTFAKNSQNGLSIKHIRMQEKQSIKQQSLFLVINKSVIAWTETNNRKAVRPTYRHNRYRDRNDKN